MTVCHVVDLAEEFGIVTLLVCFMSREGLRFVINSL